MTNAATYIMEQMMSDLDALTDDTDRRARIWECIESAGDHLDNPVSQSLWRQVRLTPYRFTKARNLWTAVLRANPANTDLRVPTQSELIAGLAFAASEHRHPVNRNTNNRGA